jgi:hypothetical protein
MAMQEAIVRHLVQRVLILNARRDYLADEHALMELLAVPQHILDERYASVSLLDIYAISGKSVLVRRQKSARLCAFPR